MATPVTATRQMALPFAIDASGRVATVTDATQQLADRVAQIITTGVNTRLMHPDFGLDLGGILFSALDDETATLLGVQVRTALATWEPAAALRKVTPVLDTANGVIGIDVEYTTQLPTATGDQGVQSAFISIGA
jgi:phage baseplate assembly protein W